MPHNGGIYLKKLGMPAVEMEQKLAGRLNSSPAEQANNGRLIMFAYQIPVLKGERQSLDWQAQQQLLTELRAKVRLSGGRVFFHRPPMFPVNFEGRLRRFKKGRKRREEGAVALLGDKLFKLKHWFIDTAKIRGIQPQSNKAGAAGAFVIDDGSPSGSPVPIRPIPGIPDLPLDDLRVWVWTHQEEILRRRLIYRKEHTPDGQGGQTYIAVALE